MRLIIDIDFLGHPMNPSVTLKNLDQLDLEN